MNSGEPLVVTAKNNRPNCTITALSVPIYTSLILLFGLKVNFTQETEFECEASAFVKLTVLKEFWMQVHSALMKPILSVLAASAVKQSIPEVALCNCL
ncbi:hypothetical protein FQA39_LY04353 [Lamprigera yunnana]|nr:hypothetical protein FQA39_LY04353 [Lamprigera yunnana]